MSIFRNLKIGVKIILGYLIALILMMVVGGVAIVRLDQVDNAMGNIIKNSAKEEVPAKNIVVQILLARFYANKYINSQNPADLTRHNEEWSKLKELLTNAETSVTKAERVELLKQIKSDFAAYEVAVTEIDGLIAERNHVTTNVLDKQGQQTLDLLNQLQESLSHTYNPTAINHIANAQKAFLVMQLDVYKYLVEGNEEWIAAFDQNKTQFQTAMGELDSALRDMNQRKMMETSNAAAEDYIAAFGSLKSAYARQKDLQTNALDVLGPQIRTTATKMSDSVRAEIEAEIATTDLMVKQTRFILIGTILGATVLGLGLGFLISRGITRPLHAVTEASQQIVNVDLPSLVTALGAMAQGDLTCNASVTTQPLSIASGDEVGVMAGAFNSIIERLQEANTAFGEMTINLRQLVGQVSENAHNVGAASGQLAAAAEQAGEATSQITTTIQQVTQGIAQQIDGVSQASQIVKQVSRAIDGVAKGAQEQAVAVTQSSEITNQMAVAIQQVEANAQAGSRGAAMAAQTARDGSKTVEATIQGMIAIKAKVGMSVHKVQEMGQRSMEIGMIVQTIDDIASQTNLLALNAAIEAARAGEHGKGFAVVADEVRKLAEKSATATKEIGGLIRSIQQTVAEAVTAMESGAVEVESGVSRANEAGQALAAILDAAKTVNQQAEEISAAVQQMGASSNELVSAMDTVSAVVEENTAATEEMAAGSGEITQVIDNIASVGEDNSAAMEEVSAAAEEMNAQVEEVTASAQSLSDMAQALLQLVAQFRLAKNEAQRKVQMPQPTPAGEAHPPLSKPDLYEPISIANGNGKTVLADPKLRR